MSIPAVFLNPQTMKVYNFNDVYPREDGAPIAGLPADQAYMIKREVFPVDNYDRRLYKEVITVPQLETMLFDDIPDHPDYPGVKQYLTLHELEKRTNEEIEEYIRDSENYSNNQVVASREQFKTLMFWCYALSRRVAGAKLTEKELAMEAEAQAAVSKMWLNNDLAEQKITELDSGKSVDIDALWELSK